MYSATPIGGSTGNESGRGADSNWNTPMGTKFNAECTFFRTQRGYRGRHHPPATGYGRP